MKQRFLFLFFICIYLTANTQSPPHYIIGAEELSNVDVYSLYYEEETDVLYVGSNRGAYVYKQNMFRHIPSDKQQIGSSLFQLKKNKRGELFCSNLSGQIFKIKNDSLQLFYELPKSEIKIDFRYYFDQDNNLIINSAHNVIKVTPEGNRSMLKDLESVSEEHKVFLEEARIYNSSQLSDGKIYFSTQFTNHYLVYDGERLRIKDFPREKNQTINNFIQLGEEVFFSTKNGFANIISGELKPEIDINKSSNIYHFDQNKSIIANRENGFNYLTFENDKILMSKLLLPKIFVSTSCVNAKKTVFLGTFKEGVVVITNSKILKYKTDFPVKAISSDSEDKVYLMNQNGVYLEPKKESNDYFNSIPTEVDEELIQSDFFIHKGKVTERFFDKSEMSYKFYKNVKDLDIIDSGFFNFILPYHVYIVPREGSSIKAGFAKNYKKGVYRIELKNRGRSVAYNDLDKHLYYSTNLGTFRKKWNTSIVDTLKFEGIDFQSNDLVSFQDKMFAATEKNGILIFRNNKIHNKIDLSSGLRSNAVTKLNRKDNLLFILTIRGLQVYNLESNNFIGLGESEGVVSSEVKDFAVSSSLLWILDKKGYYPYPIEAITKRKKNEIGELFLDSIVVNSNAVVLNGKNGFKYSENYFEVYFDYRDIETKKETQILYKMEGVSNDWKKIETTVNSISFPSLAPGKYKLLIKANYRGEETEVLEYKIQIFQPFWFQWWFIASCVIILLLLSFIFYSLELKRSKKNQQIELEKKKMQLDVFESKLKAIRSQMNPHFIFNSLNSIQALVLKNDKKKSYDYIEMFSDLVRKTLSFSEKNYVSIKDELSFLEIYLNLESLRMKDEFTFSIINKVENEIKIPSLLIQPFLENAIHHGLLHKPNNKKLTVTFELRSEYAFCIIEDNGIGRVRAAEINERQQYRHESFSLNATEERLRILSANSSHQYNYSIEDLYHEDGQPMGTKVIVKFPFKHEF